MLLKKKPFSTLITIYKYYNINTCNWENGCDCWILRTWIKWDGDLLANPIDFIIFIAFIFEFNAWVPRIGGCTGNTQFDEKNCF